MIRISVAPADFVDWPELLDLLQSSFAFMAGRIDPPSSLEMLDAVALRHKAVGFEKAGESCHPGFCKPTRMTMRKPIPCLAQPIEV